ncbi:MAG: hypothetical protein Q9169_007216 [Polycauliona sp. 2 TL-2023]
MFDPLPNLTPLTTLHNCFMFGNVSNAVYESNGVDYAADFGYEGGWHNATSDNVAHVLEDCFVSYCQGLPDCSEDYRQYDDNSSLWGEYYYMVSRGHHLVRSICDNIPWRIDSEVGGIGTGLAFLGFLGTFFWQWILPYGHTCYLAARHGWNGVESRSQRLRRVAKKHLSRHVAALTDFHKAQCFSMLAINIATLVAIQRGGFDLKSLQQIYDTYVFLQVLAVNGFLPITFTLANLYLVGMLSCFLVLLSTVTVVLSIATLTSVGKFNPSEADMRNLATLAASGGPPECDGMQPGIYCLQLMRSNSGVDDFYDGQSIPKYAWTILGFCLAILLALIGCQLQIQNTGIVRSTQRYVTPKVYTTARFVTALSRVVHRETANRLPSGISHAARTYWNQTLNLLVILEAAPVVHTTRLKTTSIWQFCTEGVSHMHQQRGCQSWFKLALRTAVYVVVFTFYVRFYNIYLHDLAWFAENNVNGNTWNFGQVFAITVWLPPVVEYIHLEMRGMHRAFDHRLVPPFRISRTPTVDPMVEIDTTHILPTKLDIQHDLENGTGYDKLSSAPVELRTPASACSITFSSSKDDDVGKAGLTQEYNNNIDDSDIATRQGRYTHGYHRPTDQPDAIEPPQSYAGGQADEDGVTEGLLPALDFSRGGDWFSDVEI